MGTGYEMVWTYDPTFFLVYVGFSSMFAIAVIMLVGKGWSEVTIRQFFYAIYFFVAWPIIFPLLFVMFLVGLLGRKRKSGG